jgi:putative tributyrin esterase
MALVSCDFHSDALEVGTAMTVVLPEPTWPDAAAAGQPGERSKTPVLYLLHGLSDDHTMWLRQTSVERYAAPLGLAVVMPAVHRSLYADEAHGHAYWTFLSQELPQVVSSLFRVSDRPEDTYVAGLSMGGYGALKWAFHEPSRFAAVASMSGILDVAALAELPERQALFHRVFEGAPAGRDDLFSLLGESDVGALPPMHISCGTEDHLFDGNVAFVRAARGAGLAPTVDFRPGAHDWAFWDAEIHTVLEWLPGLPRCGPDPH